jgi:hypothetical protein
MTLSRTIPFAIANAALVLAGACGGSNNGTTNTGNTGDGVQNPVGTAPVVTAGMSASSGGSGAAPSRSGSAGRGTSPLTAAGSGGSTTAPSGSAGSSSTTTMPAAGSGGSGSASAGSDGGPYFVSGSWHGFAWTSASGMGSTIMPMDFSAVTPGMPRCVKGSVAATTDYSGVAMLGVNLNQGNSTGAMQMTVTPSKAGVQIDVMNNAMSPLRFQVQGLDGATNADDRWCAVVTGSGGFIPWSMFNTACWDGSGKAYYTEPISAAMLLVPGGTDAAVPIDFCLTSLSEADGAGGAMGAAAGSGGSSAGGAGNGNGAAGSGGSTGMMTGSAGSGSVDPGMNTGSGMLTDKYASAMVMRDGKNYVVQNNVWGADATQTLTYTGTTFEVTSQTGNTPSSGPNAIGPVSYPSVFIGSNNNRTTQGSNLPIAISAIKSVKTAWSVKTGVPGTYNAAYDVWFSTGSGGDPAAPSGGYLMVWFYKPSNAQPIGPQASAQGVTIPGVKGTWDVWIGPNTGNSNRPVISYVATSPIDSMEFDLNAFIQDALKRPNALQSSWYLTNVFAGFEIWSGGTGLKTTSFYATVE